MRRITIITGLLAAALVPAASAHAARPLAKADAERLAVRHMQVSASNTQAYGLFEVTNTSYRCQRATARRIVCNFALFLRGLRPEATERLCLSTVAIVRTPGDRVVREISPVVCA